MVLIGWMHPAEPLIGGLAGAYVQWVLFILMPLHTLILQMALSFPGGRLTRAARITVGAAWTAWFIGAIAIALDTRAERCPACPPNPDPVRWSWRIGYRTAANTSTPRARPRRWMRTMAAG